MKKIFLITCCLFLGINISLSEMVSQREMVMGVQLEGEKFIDSKCPIRKANHSFNEVVFEVNAPSGGNYWISFWMCAPLLKNGDYSNYTVWVNERDSVGIISTKSPDWQCVTFDVNKPVLLKKGKNSISVRGKSSLFPNVERIRLSIKPDNSIIDGTQYQKYIGDIDQEVAPESKFEQETTPVNLTGKNFKGVELLASSSQDPPLYNYNYALDFPFSYTFHTDLHLNEGENIDISAKGWNYFSYKLYLFNIEDPTSYSWSANSSTSNYLAMLNVKAPKTGTYKIFLTSFFPDRKGKCDININDSIQYNRVPVSYSGLLCSGIEDMSTEYNVFTCNSTEDTELYLLKTAGFNKDVIFAYNDDANFNSDYDWDCNSRLRVCFPTNTITALICPYSSSAPEGICDVYLNCKDSNIISYFPLLKKDDAIQSSPESIVYNCISWSAGITTDWHWPPSEDSDYYSEDPLEAFDNYYKAFGLTRSGATRENAIVALWGIVDNNGDIEYTHASVTRGDGNVHGYDWESKPGSLMRTFHPCDALEGLDYGKILEYYTLNQQESRLNKSIEIINSKTDSISFDSVEKNIIYDNIHNISSNIAHVFNKLYEDWNKITKNTIYSNPNQISDCEEYRKIYSFCVSHPECIYYIYDELAKGDLAAIILSKEILLSSSASKTLMKEIHKENLSKGLYASNKSNLIKYAKLFIKTGGANLSLVKENHAEQTDNLSDYMSGYSVISNNNSVNISFTLKNEVNTVSLRIADLYGNNIKTLLDNKVLNKESFTFIENRLQSGFYVIHLNIDGKVHTSIIKI